MAGRRRRHKSQGEAEADLLANGRWCGLKEQDRLQALNHTREANELARAECRRLREHGYGTDATYMFWKTLLDEQ